MDNYYIVSTAMIIFSMVIMIVSVKYNIGLGGKRKRASAMLFAIIIVGAVCECSGTLMNGNDPSLIPLHVMVKTIELSTAPFIGLLCGRSFSDSRLERFLCGILCANTVLEIISVFTGFIFYVDSNNVYHHGQFYLIYLISYILGIAYFIVQGISMSRRFQGKYGLTIVLTVMYVLACIVTQLINSSIKIDWLAISIGAIMLYKFYGDMLLQIDGLTGLLNHWSYEQQIHKLSKKAIIIFFDVDKFKYVNDTYGHAVGDTCLQDIAKCIQSAYGKCGLCFRYGGDEFCVLATKSLDEIENATKDFCERLDNKRLIDEWMPRVSYGYTEYDPAVDNIYDVINKADEMMYSYKQQNK